MSRSATCHGRQDAPAKNSVCLADVLAFAVSAKQPLRLSKRSWKALGAIMACRTPAMGGNHYRCKHCGREHSTAHSCRNRHCPSCQGAASYQWLDKQRQALLPIPYFHMVFTLPHQFNDLISRNQAVLYKLLFDCSSQTLLLFGKNNLKAQIGITAVLHTWGQTLYRHYHLHCLVTGGGIALDGSGWKDTGKYFCFPVKALSKVFRAKYCEGLMRLYEQGKIEFDGDAKEFKRLLRKTCRRKWIVYAKRPFAGPKQVLSYLSLYTHRIAIGNSRILALDKKMATVTFAYKDYADHSRKKTMTLEVTEFVTRFCWHVLPQGFVKIRHYGILANRSRKNKINEARSLLAEQKTEGQIEDPSLLSEPSPGVPRCPFCGSDSLVLTATTHKTTTSFKPP